MGHAFSH